MRVSRLASESVAAVILLLAAPVSAQSAWTIPGIVSASGLNDTRFVSDVTVTNPGANATQVTVSFVPSSTSNAKTVTLNAGETLVYRNVVESLFGTSGAGALSISCEQPLLVRAKTYNTAASGTYGVALPVVASDRLLGAGDVADSLWVSQDTSGSAGFRTNVALVFPDESGGAATVTVFDADGNERGHQDFSLDAPGLQQFSVGSFAGAVSVARARVAVTRGYAAGYAVVVDNVTGDSSLFTFEDLPAGRQDVLINGVARANGRNGTFFRTDGRFYNPTDTDATVQVSFHASGNANPAPATASFTLPAGKIRDVVDVLDTLLALPVGSAGALRFQSNWPVAILCRTSNVDPAGSRPGTFGAQQKPVPLLSFVTSADAGAAITGIRQDAAFRTNVGFAAGEAGAAYTLTLATAAGATVATTSGSLGAWGWSQPNVQDLFPGTSIPADATLKVRVTQGSVDVYDSSIDNLSGDPVVTPIAPLPTAIPSSATIGTAGGSIRSSDGRLTLRIPAGALAQATALSFQPATNDAPLGRGPGYQLAPATVTFANPALLTLAYGSQETEGSSAEALTLAVSASDGWYGLGGGSVDPARHTLTAPLASTASALVAPAGDRAALTSGPGTFAPVDSWEFSPRGRRVILVGGQLPLAVKFVGYSSSTVAYQGRVFLGSDPSKVDVTWYVNGQPNGNIIDGTVVAFGTDAVYTAGSCPPPRNPVSLGAVIANSGLFSFPYQVRFFARVRVLPKKFRLVFGPRYRLRCEDGKGEVSDSLHWGDASESESSLPYVEFSLDQLLTASTGVVTLTKPVHHLGSCAGSCPAPFTPLVQTGFPDEPLKINATMEWDVNLDKMKIELVGGYAGTAPVEDFLQSAILCTVDTIKASGPNLDDLDFTWVDGLQMEPGASLTRSTETVIGAGALTLTYFLKGVCP